MLTRLGYLLIVVFVGLGSIAVFQVTRGRPVEATSIVTGPAQTLVDAPLSTLGELLGSFDSVRRLQRENNSLRAEVDRLRQETARLPELEHENKLLREQANYRKEHPEHELLSARIIGRDPNPLVSAVTIDQGTVDGLADGMVVVAPAGLVGRIERAGPSSSKVLLLTDSLSAVNCVVQATRARGVAEGSVLGSVKMRYVEQDEVVRVGDQVVTSGLGSLFPPGLLVGWVSDVRKRDVDPSQEVVIAPAVDVDRLESVLVITSFRPARLD